jgi:hypothetical protein
MSIINKDLILASSGIMLTNVDVGHFLGTLSSLSNDGNNHGLGNT